MVTCEFGFFTDVGPGTYFNLVLIESLFSIFLKTSLESWDESEG